MSITRPDPCPYADSATSAATPAPHAARTPPVYRITFGHPTGLSRHRARPHGGPFFQVSNGAFHDIGVDPSDLIGIPDEQTVVADHVHDARDSSAKYSAIRRIAALLNSWRSEAPATRR